MSDREQMGARFIAALHREEGRCGHCGKRDCPERINHSKLPLSVRLVSVFKALSEAAIEPVAEPAPERIVADHEYQGQALACKDCGRARAAHQPSPALERERDDEGA